MKKLAKTLVLVVLFGGILLPDIVSAQSWGGKHKPGVWDDWEINMNAGLTSFFGDLSLYDSDITGKLTKESKPAFSGILVKNINSKFGLGGQLLYGGLQGENASSMSFEATIIEYNFHFRFNAINLIFPDNLSNFGLVGYAGAGQFVFNVTQYDARGEDLEIKIHDTGTPEFVYFLGTGVFYKVTDKFSATADMALRQAQNDKLDDFNKNGNFDYYTHISFGITYHIDSFKKSNGFSRGKSTKGRSSGRLPMRRRR